MDIVSTCNSDDTTLNEFTQHLFLWCGAIYWICHFWVHSPFTLYYLALGHITMWIPYMSLQLCLHLHLYCLRLIESYWNVLIAKFWRFVQNKEFTFAPKAFQSHNMSYARILKLGMNSAGELTTSWILLLETIKLQNYVFYFVYFTILFQTN